MVQVIQFLPRESYPVFRALLIATIYQATDMSLDEVCIF